MFAIQENIGERPVFCWRKPEKYFLGEVFENTFRLMPAPDWGRGLAPVIDGSLHAVEGGTRIAVRQHGGLFELVWFSAFWLFVLAVIVSFGTVIVNGAGIQPPHDFLGWVMPLVIIPWMFFGARQYFRSEAQNSRERLKQIVKGSILEFS